MSKNCFNCGAEIADGSKICSNCGMVVKNSPKQTVNTGAVKIKSGSQTSAHRMASLSTQDAANVFNDQPLHKRRPTKGTYNSTFTPEQRAKLEKIDNRKLGSGRQDNSRLMPLLRKSVFIIFIIVLLAVGFMFVRIFMVKQSTYKFETKMKLSCNNYGEAMNNFFGDSGKWHFDFRKNEVSYTGTHKNKSYVLIFKKDDGQTVVDKLTINDEEVDKENIMEIYVLGMFMTDSDYQKYNKALYNAM